MASNKINFEIGYTVDKSGLNELTKSLQNIYAMSKEDLVKINNTSISQAAKQLSQIKTTAGAVEIALQSAFNQKLGTVNLQTFNTKLQESNLDLKTVYTQFSQAGVQGENAFRGIANTVLNSNLQLKETSSVLSDIGTTLKNTIKWNISSSVINQLVGSVQEAYGYVKNLDSSLNDIRIVTGYSADEMDKFAEKANKAAKALGQSTTDYTNASLIFYQQGLGDEEVQARTDVTLKAANVTGQSTSEVSEQLTAVWNGYQASAEEAELYVDRLAAVAASTASDLEELSTGMSKVASSAAAMGVGEDQLAAQLSTIISVTRQAPESVGTALKTIYARMTDIEAGIDEDGVSLGNYSGAMAEMGFNVLDANGKLRDMGEVIEEIGGKWEDLTREQQISLAQTMAGTRLAIWWRV